MLIVMKPQATEGDIRGVCEKIEALGYRAHPMPGAQRTAPFYRFILKDANRTARS